MMNNNYIVYLFITELIFVGVSYYISKGNIISPSLLSFVMFTFSTGFVLLNIDFWQVQYSLKAWVITTLGFFSMLLPELLFYKRRITTDYCFQEIRLETFIRIFINISTILCAIFFLVLNLKRGVSLGGVGLTAIGYAKHQGAQSLIGKILYRYTFILFYSYAYIIIHNINLAKKSAKSQLRYLIPVLSFFLVTFFDGNRLGIVKNILAIFACYISTKFIDRKPKKRELFKILKTSFVVGFIMMIIFYFLRYITKVNTTTRDRVFFDYISYYIGSPIYLFSKYIDNPLSVHAKNTLFGETTLSSILAALGYSPVNENVPLYVGGQSMFAGNAMSWFQEPLQDYGIVGMFIFTFIIYFIMDYVVYKGIFRKKNTSSIVIYMFYIYVPVMSFYYCHTMDAISFSNFIYIFMIVLVINNLPRISIKRGK